jgi:hypothetical protein
MDKNIDKNNDNFKKYQKQNKTKQEKYEDKNEITCFFKIMMH